MLAHHLVPVVGHLAGVAPRGDDDLRVGVHVDEVLQLVPPRHHKVADVARLRLREGPRPVEGVGAGLVGRPHRRPLEVEVAVGVRPHARRALVRGPARTKRVSRCHGLGLHPTSSAGYVLDRETSQSGLSHKPRRMPASIDRVNHTQSEKEGCTAMGKRSLGPIH